MDNIENSKIIKVTENCKIIENDNIIEFYITNISDYSTVKELCQYDKPFNVTFIWDSYKIFLESFIMENISKDIGEFSTFYGKCKSYNIVK